MKWVGLDDCIRVPVLFTKDVNVGEFREHYYSI